jgi:hypothetical protein
MLPKTVPTKTARATRLSFMSPNVMFQNNYEVHEIIANSKHSKSFYKSPPTKPVNFPNKINFNAIK